jgi:adenylate cyclase
VADVFVSYARSEEEQAVRVAEVLRSAGYTVWRDDELPAHRAYSEVIEERLRAANAVVVLWSLEATKSQWVRAEADGARTAGTLVQATLDGTLPGMPFNQIQCADLRDWSGDVDAPGWRKLEASVAALARPHASDQIAPQRRQQFSICVLPFQNMSGEAEQEYFSDGISEDITTDLSKVSALAVTARNTAFTFKSSAVDVCEVARKLNVSHVLEGSVRKVGGRLRITAQLVEGLAGDHVWAERYDRDLTDIFAIQDEISKAIVDALKLKLLPAEKKAIENRGTTNVDAYNIYLMARQQRTGGVLGNPRKDETVVRLCEQAIRIDPEYAQAWALLALAQTELRFWFGRNDDALSAAERAIKLNPQLAEAHCVRARYLEEDGRKDEAEAQVRTALKLDADSWEANREAAYILFRHGRVQEAIPHFRKAADLMDTDWSSPLLLISCYNGTGNVVEMRAAASLALQRVESALAHDSTNGSAIAAGAASLGVLGQTERAREWTRRALLLDPDNSHMRYNLACGLISLGAHDEAMDIFATWFATVSSPTRVRHAEADPDLHPLRTDPRFQQMLASAKERLARAAASD